MTTDEKIQRLEIKVEMLENNLKSNIAQSEIERINGRFANINAQMRKNIETDNEWKNKLKKLFEVKDTDTGMDDKPR